MPIGPLEAVAALRLALATANTLGQLVENLQAGKQPTPEELDAVTAARKLAKDNLTGAIDEVLGN